MAENIRHNADTAEVPATTIATVVQENIPVVGGASCGDDGFHLVSVISRPGELSPVSYLATPNVVVRFDASRVSTSPSTSSGADRDQSAPHI